MRIILVILGLLLASCSPAKMDDERVTPQEKSIATAFIAALQSGRIDTVKASLKPQLYEQTQGIDRSFQAAIPKDANYNLVSVVVETNSANGIATTLKALNYEFGAGTKWAVFQIVETQTPGGPQIVGWHAVPYDRQPSTSGNFTFAGKGALNYLWLVAMMLSTLTIVVTLVIVGRSHGVKRRWLWAIGSALGLGQFTLNWTTGAWGVRPLGFLLLGSAAFKASPFDAWMLSFSLPVVAVIFLLRRKALMAQPEETSFD